MKIKHFQGLEIAEIALFGLTTLGLIVAIASGQWFLVAIALWLTLALSFFNRLRREGMIRQQIRVLKQQQRQILDEQLNDRLLKSPILNSSNDSGDFSIEAVNSQIQSLKQIVVLLEQSLAQIQSDLRHQSDQKQYLPVIAPVIAPDRPPEPLAVAEPKTPLKSPAATMPLQASARPKTAIVNWQAKHLLKQHLDRVSALSLSPEGRYLASVSWDQTLKLWDWRNGEELGTIQAHDHGIQSVVFVGDRKIATGSYDQKIKIWSFAARESGSISLQLDATLTAHQGSVQSLAIAAQNQILVSGSYDQTVKQWTLEKAELLISHPDFSGAISVIALDPHQQLIAAAGGAGLVTLWRMTGKESLFTLSGNVSSP